ncbi:C4-dicarboxylate TRAP transporter substrate-binding protein [Pusillimonas sp. SM2304]|uniref:C4-dicarboxylate TRAP transporter substrate-binding protein n=1 Tax=Pusillimonas sp. SM2304 TaxID=3073241 RepID=UPI002876F142|nr:C4-dicarboxylate TRAP transporter substrate-binding protein [Pusillimonas sp. SM2304]MDS1139203.1 C4-dicarboxylate TRAP transporter substrate-binding protein [Pusillimonas sp. SM2304]
MQIKKLWTAVALSAALGFSSVAGAKTELNASIWFPESQPLTRYGYMEWAKKVDKASDGDIKINVFTDTTLLPVVAHLSGLRDGIADITYHAGTYTPSDLPEDNVLAVLGIVQEDPLLTTFAVADFYMNDPDMQALWKRQKITFLGAYASVPYVLICRKKVENIGDLKGLKLRTAGPVYAEWARSVGAAPVNVPSSEMFTGLDKGQIDCAVMGANELKTRSLWDVAKHVNLANLGPYFAGWEWAMNRAKWNKLTDGQRRILLDTIAESTVETELAYIAVGDEAIKESSNHGVTVYQPSSEIEQSITDFASHARALAVKEGTERFKLKDAEGLISRFEATVAKWDKLMQGVDRTDAKALTALLKDNLYSKIDEKTYGK